MYIHTLTHSFITTNQGTELSAAENDSSCFEEEGGNREEPVLTGCTNGHCGNGGGKKRESEGHCEDAPSEEGARHEGEEYEAVAPGNKRALSQDENDRRQ